MTNFVSKYRLRPGDRILVPKSGFNIVQHHAVYLGKDQYGRPFVAENNVNAGVRLLMVGEFFRQNPKVTRIERFSGTEWQRRQVVEKALTKLGQPYDLWNYNCEHFVNEVITGKRTSSQVSTTVTLSVLAILFGLALRRS